MKRTVLFALGLLAISVSSFAQAPADAIEKALSAAPRNLKEGAAVIKFKADGTYDTLKPGTNRLACYDRSGEPGQQPFAVQCSSVANIPRIAQNKKFEAMPDKGKAAAEAAEKDGSRAKPEFGSVWYTMNGADKDHARTHITGHRSRIAGLEKLIVHMKSKPGVWFATHEQIARYVKANSR